LCRRGDHPRRPRRAGKAARPAMKWRESLATAVIAAAGLALAAGKAATASITTDEAWNYNDWIARGFEYSWTHYQAANNHLLNTLLARASVLAFGDTELALRLPALFGFALFLGSAIALGRRLIARAPLRLVWVASAALHPYL